MILHALANRLILVAAAASLVFGTALACDQHPHGARVLTKAATPAGFWPGPVVSGSWFDASRSGEGIIVQYLPDGSAIAFWFTYPPDGEAGEQAWLVAQQGAVVGNTLRFAAVYRPQGARFGAGFNPADVVLQPWGTLELEFADCGRATLRYTGPAAFGSGTRQYSRLTTLDELECGGARELTASGARALSGLRSRSGAWYVPARAGEGWLVEELPDGRTLVYWFTFDPQGRQAWTVGAATREGNRLRIEASAITRGTRFGDSFVAANVTQQPWGLLEFDFGTCGAAQVSYASTVAGYGSGMRQAARLTTLAGAPCIDGTPTPPVNPAWTELARTPDASQSEHAAAVLDGKVYIMGGFGDVRGFKRYDRATDSWTRLPDLPAGRDHLTGFAFPGSIYMVGGEPNGPGDQATAGFRYDVAGNRWETTPVLQSMFGSHAAVLHGRAYIGDLDGTLQEFDPAQNRVRRIAAADFTERDHSQVVAFQDEIWIIAGRSPETTTVAIYDPVSERWRAGPPLIRRRGGFGAAVVGNYIVLTGGEVLSGMTRVESTAETYTVGEPSWRTAPMSPVPTHGLPGASVNGRFLAISGTTIASSASGATGRVFELNLGVPTQ
jgi:N-acetylneuraminic acid mutarotase